MITRFALLSGRLLVAFAFLFTVTACGGGGGGGGSFVPDQDGDETLFLAVTLIDADGNETNSVSTGAPTTVRVKVTRNGKNGKVLADVVVTLETDAGTISPGSGTALTNSSGIATFRIQVDADTKGAGTLTATAENDTGSFTGNLNFQIGSSGLRLGYLGTNGNFIENEIDIQPGTLLASQAIAQLTLVILDENGDLDTGSQSVTFDSGCLASGQATLEPVSPVMTGDGKISASYVAAGCSGNDQITASLVGSSAQAFGTVTVASSQATGFTFVDAVPKTIVLRGTGGGGGDRSESSSVTFRVVDSNNAPLSGVSVDFDLTTFVGGLSFSPATAVSNGEGIVKVNVFSGDIPTAVRVKATASAGDGSGQEVSTVSDILTVSTGLPDQNSISLSVSDGFVIEEGFTKDGITRTLTVRMADTFNNPVPDGTAAVFTTEYGVIEPSCETVNGSCSVVWTSQAPRFPTLTGSEFIQTIFSPGYNCPSLNNSSGPCPDDLGYTRGGRSTVVVTAVGNESFVDRNGNGVMDEAEKDLFDNLSEAWRDDNEDGIYNPATTVCKEAGADTPQCIAGQEEIFTDFNNNGKFDKNRNPAIYNGLLCPPEGDGIWCSRELVNVRDSAVLILSDPSQWYIALYRGANRVTGTSWSGGVYTAYVSDIFNNRPPAGSSVELSADGDCEVIGNSSFTVGNTTAYGAFAVAFQTGGVGSTGSLDITVTPTDTEPYTMTFNCVPEPPPVDPNDPDGGLVISG
jgi:hypothetical protein